MRCTFSVKNGANSARRQNLYEIWGSEIGAMGSTGGKRCAVKFKTGASQFESQSAPAPFTVAQVKLHIVSNNVRPSTFALVRARESLDCESIFLCLIPRSRDLLHVYIV